MKICMDNPITNKEFIIDYFKDYLFKRNLSRIFTLSKMLVGVKDENNVKEGDFCTYHYSQNKCNIRYSYIFLLSFYYVKKIIESKIIISKKIETSETTKIIRISLAIPESYFSDKFQTLLSFW